MNGNLYIKTRLEYVYVIKCTLSFLKLETEADEEWKHVWVIWNLRKWKWKHVCVFADLTRGAMTEFQEKLRQQHEESMHRELEALLTTANKVEAEVGKTAALLRLHTSPPTCQKVSVYSSNTTG